MRTVRLMLLVSITIILDGSTNSVCVFELFYISLALLHKNIPAKQAV